MAILDVVRFTPTDDSVFVWKHPSSELALGSQLVVNEGQEAVFVKGGQALDVFGPGTHKLDTGNIPLLRKLINLPFGGRSPFTAEVWFVSTTVKRDLKWGTASPIPLMDPALGFPVSARGFGKWGARIRDSRRFVTQMVGAQLGADATRIREYFIGEIVQGLVKNVGKVLTTGEASVLQIATLLGDLSKRVSDDLYSEFDRFGLEVVNFNIESINIPQEEMQRIQDVFAKTMEARELSKVEVGGAYAAIKSFDVMEKAAENPSGGMGAMMGAGMGAGVGFPLGAQMAQQVTTKNAPDAPDAPSADAPSPTERLRKLKELLAEGLITQEQFDSKRDAILSEI